MDRLALIKAVRDILAEAGFQLSDTCSFRTVGFDIVARREKTLFIVKVLTNVDSLSEDVAKDLRSLSSILNASLLLVGERDGSAPLEDGVLYFRNGVQTITVNSLRRHLLENMPIQVYAAPGGLYVNIDGKRLREVREKKNLSRGDLARMIHVSRKSVRMYEEGMDARVEVAALLEEILLPDVINNLDILKPMNPRYTNTNRTNWLYEFQREIFSLLERVGYKIIPINRCPFEAFSKERTNLILTLVHRGTSSFLKERARMVASISRITEKHAVIFVDREIGDRKNVEGTPMIVKHELIRLRDPYEILDMIIEREE